MQHLPILAPKMVLRFRVQGQRLLNAECGMKAIWECGFCAYRPEDSEIKDLYPYTLYLTPYTVCALSHLFLSSFERLQKSNPER